MKIVTLLIASVTLALLTVEPARAGATYRVGTGCTYATIQDAVDAIPNQGSGIIRIRSGTYNENIAITNKTVDLLGGHADCATTSAPGITHIDASGSTSPAIAYFVIAGPAGNSHALTTDKLNLFEGTGNVLARGGGVSVFTDADRTAGVTLQRTFVRNNQTEHHGGGIALYGNGGGSLALLENSQLEQNRVTGDDPHGGGLYCAGDYAVTMIGGSIHGNVAGETRDSDARGGGVYLDGCDMIWFAQNQLATVDDAALRNNTVYGDGGGLFVTGDAQVELIGAHFTIGGAVSSRPLRIHDNRALPAPGIASGRGGAVHVDFFADASHVRLDRTWIFDNDANIGGAFFLAGGELTVTRGSQTCHSSRRCSRVFDNTATASAVVGAQTGGTAIFEKTIFAGNVTSSPVGSLMRAASGGTIRIFDSLIHDNEAAEGFLVDPGTAVSGGAVLRLERSTVAANTFADSVAVFATEQSNVRIYDSIIHEPGTTMAAVSGSPDVGIDCVIWHDNQLGGFRTQVADPMFVDPQAGLFYLQPDSPAINYCDAPPPPPGVDLDWNPRGISHSGQPDLFGPYDLGAYELPLGIFEDRFEQP